MIHYVLKFVCGILKINSPFIIQLQSSKRKTNTNYENLMPDKVFVLCLGEYISKLVL